MNITNMINMKNIKNLSSVLLIALAFAACNKDDESLENVRTVGGKPTVTVNPTASVTTEGLSTTFTLTVDKPISSDMNFKIEVADGSVASFRDFDCSVSGVPVDETTIDEGGFGQGKIGYILTFPAYATTSSFTITPKVDILKEGTELLKLRLSSALNANGLVAPSSEIISMSVADYVSNDVGLELVWDKQTTVHGTIIDKPYLGADGNMYDTSLYDFDLTVEDSGTNTLNWDGASLSNPEFTELLATDLDDTYYVKVQLFSPAAAKRPKVAFAHDIKLNISKYGTWATTISIPLTTTQTFADYVAVITKTGNTYVVTDYNTSAVLASGKIASRGSLKAPLLKRNK